MGGFGQQPQDKPAGLFGAPQQAPATGGLFGQGGQGAGGSGGLFGAPQGQPNPGQTSAFGGGGGFGTLAQGSASTFTSQQPGGFASTASAFGTGGTGGG